MARKDIYKDGVNTQFGNGQDPTKGGRKKKIYTILKDKGYSKDDVVTSFTEMLFYSIDELKEVAQDRTKPIIMGIVATALRDAYIDGDYKKGKDIIEQVIGRALQRQEITGKDGKDFEINIIDLGKGKKPTE
jgi:hypothetical protein